MAADQPRRIRPRAEGTRDVLDLLASSNTKTGARQTEPEPLLGAEAVAVEPSREILAQKNARRLLGVLRCTPSALAHYWRGANVSEDRGEVSLPGQRHSTAP